MGRLFSGSILPIYWKLLIVKTVLKHMVHFFNDYSVHSSCIWYLLGPVAITGSAAIIDGKKTDFSFNTILGWRKFIIGAQDQTNAHWRNLCDLWHVKLCFRVISSGFRMSEGTYEWFHENCYNRSEHFAPSENRHTVIWSKLHPFSSITMSTIYVVWIWCLYDQYIKFRTPRSVP